MTADISIIIPSRNRLWSLPHAVQSCRSSRLNIQIVVVDDGSTDGTAEWLATQPDIFVVKGYGWGKPWGVNSALRSATGTYLRYLDSDDWLPANANELQFAIAEREGADLVVGGIDLYRDDKFVKRLDWEPTDDFFAQQLGESSFGSHYSAFLFKRAFVQDIPHRTLFPSSDFASRDDRCFLLEVALMSPRIAVSQTATLCHRMHDRTRLQFQTAWGGLGTHIQHLYIYRQILTLAEEMGELNVRRKKAAVKALWPIARGIAQTLPEEANAVVHYIYQLDPTFVFPEAGIRGFFYRNLGFPFTEWLLHRRLRDLLRRFHLLRPRSKKARFVVLG